MFWLTAVEDRKPADVAARFGVTPAAVRKAKLRVLRRLREEIGDLLDWSAAPIGTVANPCFPVTHGACTGMMTLARSGRPVPPGEESKGPLAPPGPLRDGGDGLPVAVPEFR